MDFPGVLSGYVRSSGIVYIAYTSYSQFLYIVLRTLDYKIKVNLCFGRMEG